MLNTYLVIFKGYDSFQLNVLRLFPFPVALITKKSNHLQTMHHNRHHCVILFCNKQIQLQTNTVESFSFTGLWPLFPPPFHFCCVF